VAENARPPVAIRIARPYETEEAFLEHELETVGKTSVILIGAHSRPAGVILRFEVALSTGTVVLRGEGRVLAHKDNAFRGQAGLALRFTRLDPKSKAFVDRAVAMREIRLTGEHRAAPPAASSSGQLPPPSSGHAAAPPPSIAPLSMSGGQLEGIVRAVPPPEPPAPPPVAASVAPPPEPAIAAALTSPTPPPPPIAEARAVSEPPPRVASVVPVASLPAERRSPDREALLARLRERATRLTPEQKAALLGS
jgi:hypothetical protein